MNRSTTRRSLDTSSRPLKRSGGSKDSAAAGRFIELVLLGLATVQFVWCYLWLTRPYVNTAAYENGLERMPFQGRCLMMLPLKLVHSSTALQRVGTFFQISHFWFPRPVQPEVLVQSVVNILAIVVTGIMTRKLYQASSRRGLLTFLVYPIVLVVCVTTYILHTVQNFRFIYDLPSLAFFSVALYIIYARKHWTLFALLFLVATLNRETTLLLLPLYVLDNLLQNRQKCKRSFVNSGVAALASALAVVWCGWQVLVRHIFAANVSEFYPRLDWNLKSLVAPQAWPQLLSACGYLLVVVVIWRRRIPDPRLRVWLWLIPCWLVFMFSFGILIETRVFGELIPLIVCISLLILEEELIARFRQLAPELAVMDERRIRRIAA